MTDSFPKEERFTDLIGKTFEEAKAAYPNYRLRATRMNGQPMICTRDLRMDRINVDIESGKIVKVTGVG